MQIKRAAARAAPTGHHGYFVIHVRQIDHVLLSSKVGALFISLRRDVGIPPYGALILLPAVSTGRHIGRPLPVKVRFGVGATLRGRPSPLHVSDFLRQMP